MQRLNCFSNCLRTWNDTIRCGYADLRNVLIYVWLHFIAFPFIAPWPPNMSSYSSSRGVISFLSCDGFVVTSCTIWRRSWETPSNLTGSHAIPWRLFSWCLTRTFRWTFWERTRYSTTGRRKFTFQSGNPKSLKTGIWKPESGNRIPELRMMTEKFTLPINK